MELSAVIPVYNEQDNVLELYQEVSSVLDNLPCNSYEVIFVDDGSSDKTFSKLSSIKSRNLKIIKFRKNFGQSAALLAGFDFATGDIIITMDGDMQNDPKDIPRLLNKLEEGYDCVSGWRYNRKDSFLKRFFSRVSNFLRHRLINDLVNDSGCSLKAYKKECLEGIELFGEMHRYIVSLVKIKGFRVGEVKVRHRPRFNGKTKYSTSRLIKGFLDLWNIWFWQKFAARPLHLFGTLGMLGLLLGFICGSYTIYRKLFMKIDLSNTFLGVFSIFLVLAGIQLSVFGILGDAILKSYKRIKKERGYEIEKIIERK